MTYADRSSGTELTRFDPHFHDTDTGGLRCRIITDDGSIYWREMTREAVLRMIVDGAKWMAKAEKL